MTDLIQLIQQVGFPIAVAIYLLWRYDKRFQDMNTSLNSINTTLALLLKAVEQEHSDERRE
jgi:hypothetical protein